MATMAPPKKKAAPKAKRPKQQYLPQMEPPSIPMIDKLADAYVQVRDERMRLTVEETDAQDRLELKMKEHKLTVYEYDGRVVRLKATVKVEVKKKTPAEFVGDRAAKRGDGDAA